MTSNYVPKFSNIFDRKLYGYMIAMECFI